MWRKAAMTDAFGSPRFQCLRFQIRWMSEDACFVVTSRGQALGQFQILEQLGVDLELAIWEWAAWAELVKMSRQRAAVMGRDLRATGNRLLWVVYEDCAAQSR
jgi:hypothetical protein